MVNLQKTLVALASKKVEFVIVGGVAAALHGSSFATYDLDLCYSRDPPNLSRLADALLPLHPTLRDAPSGLPFLWDAETLRQGFNFTLSTDLGAVDLLAEIPGIGDFHNAVKLSISVDLFAHRFSVLSLEGLISSKRAAGRPKDLLTLPELEALREGGEK
jgi:hypothetical protein